MMRFSAAMSASVTRLMSPLVETFATPSFWTSRFPASRAVSMAKLSTSGPLGSWQSHFCGGDLQNFLYLLVPVGPRMVAGQFSKLLWNFLFKHECCEFAI